MTIKIELEGKYVEPGTEISAGGFTMVAAPPSPPPLPGEMPPALVAAERERGEEIAGALELLALLYGFALAVQVEHTAEQADGPETVSMETAVAADITIGRLRVEVATLRASVERLTRELQEARSGRSPCVDDDGTPFASARTWRAANSQAEAEAARLTRRVAAALALAGEWESQAASPYAGVLTGSTRRECAAALRAALSIPVEAGDEGGEGGGT